MARPRRFHCPGAATHVSGRAAPSAGAAFRDEAERADFLALLGTIAERMGWLVHAYCILPERYDVLLEASGPSLSRGMREVAGPYTQRANRRRGTRGPVFRGRYKAVLVDPDHGLLDLVRWIALAPVRAGLVAGPRDWPWSSHAALVGALPAPPWLETGWLLSRFDRVRWAAQAAYGRFVEDALEEGGLADPGRLVRRQVALGPEGFAERLAPSADAPRAEETPARPLAWYDAAFSDRHEAMAKAWLSGDFTQAAVARHFGVHFSTVSRAASRRIAP
jgi:hypothetical protein